MGSIDLLRKLERIDLVKMTGEALVRNGVAVLDKNREQMMAGQGIDGAQFKPYQTDPYFQGNTARADGYSRFKQRITPQTPKDIPNFFINGLTHQNLKLEITDKQYNITSTVPWASRVQAWQGNNVFGLTKQSISELWDGPVGRDVLNQFNAALK